MSIELIAIDIDGTLITPDYTISKRVKESIAYARSKGARVVICTGRPYSGAKAYLDELELHSDEDYVITYNGSSVRAIASGKEIVSHYLTADDYQNLQQLGEQEGIHMLGHTPHAIVTSNEKMSIYTSRESYLTHTPIWYRALDAVTEELEFIKIMYIDEKEKLDAFIPRIPASFTDTYEIVRSEHYYLEVLNKQAGKGNALKSLADHLGIQTEKVMAIGDNENDLTMIQFAGVGVAMGNAPEKVKQQADFVTKSNMEDGVAYAIRSYL